MVEEPKRPTGPYPRRRELHISTDEVAREIAPLRARVAELVATLAQSRASEHAASTERDALLASVSWRAMAPFRRVTGAMRKLRGSGPESPAPPPPEAEPPPGTDYDRWVRDYMTLTAKDRAAIAAHLDRLPYKPLISIVIPVDQGKEDLLQVTRATIEAQLYAQWEIRVTQDGGIAAAIQAAAGAFVAVMNPGDRLSPEALYEVAVVLNDHPATDLAYTDEDSVDAAGHRFGPAFKPDWSIDLLLGQNLVGRLAVYRRPVLLGVMSAGDAGDHSLALAMAAVSDASRIRHIPAVLYHRLTVGNEKPTLLSYARAPDWATADRAAVEAYLAGQAEIVEWLDAEPSDGVARLQVRWPLPDPLPRVSLIVPTRDNAALLARCAAGLLHRTDYPDIELIIVDNDSRDVETLGLLSRLQQDRRVRVLPYRGPFNYAAINNRAVEAASGAVIVLINDDIEVIEGDWLREMVSIAVRPDIGAVGAKLLYGDGRIQHAGVILGVGEHHGRGGIAGHFGHGAAGDDPGYLDQYALAREVSGVTAACMALRREVFMAVGGFDAEHLPIAYNDVDLCLRIRERGWRIVWTPFAELFHLESRSRGHDITLEKMARTEREKTYMRDRWDDALNHDPFYNPNFDWLYPMQRLAEPPRRPRPWHNSLGE